MDLFVLNLEGEKCLVVSPVCLIAGTIHLPFFIIKLLRPLFSYFGLRLSFCPSYPENFSNSFQVGRMVET